MPDTKELAQEIKKGLADRAAASRDEKLQALKDIFKEKTTGLPLDEKIRSLQDLKDYFSQEVRVPAGPSRTSASALVELAETILGKGTEGLEDMDQEQILQRLNDSLTTIFDTFNQIVQSLHAAAGLEGNFSPEKTIRMLIHERLSSREDMGNLSIQAYLDHIKHAFSAVREAFEKAVNEKVMEMLHEMAPERLAQDLGDKGLKLGPLYKASLFELYEERFNHLRNFVERGLFTREVMLAFERRFSEILSKSMEKNRTV